MFAVSLREAASSLVKSPTCSRDSVSWRERVPSIVTASDLSLWKASVHRFK